jgi:hypothetical protein
VAPFLLMNPYPFLTLNHLTVSKTSIAITFLSLQTVAASEWPHRPAGQAERCQAWPGPHRRQVVWLCFGLTAQGCHGADVSFCNSGFSQVPMINRPAVQCSCSGFWGPLSSLYQFMFFT